MKFRVLWVEGKRAEGPPFIPGLRKKGFNVETATTGAEALARLKSFDPDLVVLHAASMRSSGKGICRSLRERANGLPIVVIINKERVSNGTEFNANTILVLPFTPRLLINRIMPLLPGDGDALLHIGPIRLDLERNQVRALGREGKLTPRLAHLLRILMEHPGEVIERERLFREVWKTEYTEDTRTLDVHISWLRKAIEEDARKPVFIKTVRGIGYRLDV